MRRLTYPAPVVEPSPPEPSDAQQPPPPQRADVPRGERRREWILGAITLVMLSIVIAWLRPGSGPDIAATRFEDRPTIAVLPFRQIPVPASESDPEYLALGL